MEQIFYFDVSHAIEVHDEIIQKSGGLLGVKDIGNLESILEHIQNDQYYPTLKDKLTHLCFSINKNHAFTDGNKRSSIALSAFFMGLNGFNFRVRRFIREMENIAVDVADNRIDKSLLHEIICDLLYEDDFSEELKLKIVDAKSKSF